MVTCPWCGTNYAEFQSNCRNCGGPLPAPVEKKRIFAEREAEDFVMPELPPAPRPISDGYAWRLVVTDGWAISAFVFALLGFIFTITGGGLTIGIITAFVGIPFLGMGLLFFLGGVWILFWRYGEARKVVEVLKNGEPIEGEIIETAVNASVQINGRNPWTIKYGYEVGGQYYEGKVTTLNVPGMYLQPGRKACVLYLPSAQDHSTLYPHP